MNLLTRLRYDKGLSQRGVARETGLSHEAVRYIENGERELSPAHAKVLAEFYGYESASALVLAIADDLLGEDAA